MKALKALNTSALAIPLGIGLFGIIDDSCLIYAAVSTMATGFIQVMVGFFFWSERPKSIPIMIYLALVLVFFLLLKFTDLQWIWTMPPALCIYLSILVYSQKSES